MHIPAESTRPELSETKAEWLGLSPPRLLGRGQKGPPGALLHRWSVGLQHPMSILIF